jgi:hypothetical protein
VRPLAGRGAESAAVVRAVLGKKIDHITFGEYRLCLYFEDSMAIALRDDGQSSCEHRYMTTDDDPKLFAGDTLVDIEIADAPPIPEEHDEVHEVQFLKVRTDLGVMTVETHNEHNGYYGGFSVVAEWIKETKE